FSSGAGRTSDGNGSHASTLKSPSYTKSVSWQHYRENIVIHRLYLCLFLQFHTFNVANYEEVADHRHQR
ncbi:hypothetical protein B4Y71_23460, partial [Shigella boydii]|nr:hypothetical protein [Shigella boydii]